ncbi:MAG: hypothetical protein NC310_07135 [Roseburia sp.]|nr:hypothetical protein [Roseburia sp.]MCM1557806.1 hypothetical protein [Anaeroplasma bactoclasticum]
MKKRYYVNDTLHGQIELTNLEVKIFSSDSFNRLHDVYQNSTAYLTFPSNRTKRFEHSLGVLKITSDFFIRAIMNTEEETLIKFYEIFDNELNILLKDTKSDFTNWDAILPHFPKKENL